jgi:bifunctional non-homologous end joining protein LigD
VSPSLDRYNAKRDFTATPEPAGGADPTIEDAEGAEGAEGKARFVVQEHHARALHWDFRLERDGVLVSWALPKGVPPDPAVNHLAVPTEDHPLSYIDFEGEIPRGNYGAGAVHVWDRGTYDTIKWSDREVMVTLHGERVHGRHVLFRTGARQWMIHRMDPPQDPGFAALPDGWAPMRARTGELPDDAAQWSFEVAWPGLRVLAAIDGGRVRLTGTGGDAGGDVAGGATDDVTDRFPEVRPLGRAVGSRLALLDGVIVAVGDSGRPERALVARRMEGARRPPVVLMLVDVLHLDGHPLIDRPYRERRQALEALALAGAAWQTPAAHAGDGAALLEAARAQGLRGVVAKRLESVYEPGTTSDAWVEVKIR